MRAVRCLLFVAVVSLAAARGVAAAELPASPLSPEESLRHFQLDEGLKIEIVAAEPEIVDPVAARFDEGGRLWVVEMRDYPNGPAAGQPPQSRIKLLEDKDGDGRYETAHVFADKLLFATGVQPWRGGVFVTLAGRVAYMKDANGDFQADVDETWFTGFAQENPQLRANHPRLGLDGKIYVANGLRGGSVLSAKTGNSAPISLNQMDFRFDPKTGEAETVSGGGQFGLAIDDFGQRFICSNRNPVKHVVLEDRHLKRNPFLAVPAVTHDVAAWGETSRVFALSRAWTTSTLHAGQFTAACGLDIYRGDALGPAYYGNAFICEPTGNLVHREIVRPADATFTSRPAAEGREFLASPDEWFRPVNIEAGPDGALYVVDMYRAVIEHPQFVPDELKNRPDARLGEDRGRIYRIVKAGAAKPQRPAPASLDSKQLVEQLQSPNAWTRETAARLLMQMERVDDPAVIEPLKRLAANGREAYARGAALMLLSTLQALDKDTLAAALSDGDARAVQLAIRLCEGRLQDDSRLPELIAKAAGAQGAAGGVRFQAALTLGELPEAESLGLLWPIGLAGADDVWTRRAIATAVVNRPGSLLATIVGLPQWTAQQTSDGRRQLVAELAALAGARNKSEEIAPLLAEVLRPRTATEAGAAGWPATQRIVVLGLAQAMSRRGKSLAALQATWKESQPDLVVNLDELWKESAALAGDAKTDQAARLQAIALFAHSPQPGAIEALGRMATSEPSQELRLKAVEALAQHRRSEVGPLLLAGYAAQTPAVRRALLDAAVATPDRARLLLDEIAAKRIAPGELDRVRLDRLAKHSDKEIRERATKLFADAVPADRQKVLANYRPVLAMTSDPARGREIFQKNCSTCHRIAGIGVDVAPDIADSRVKQPEQLLTDILQPNKAIDANFTSYTVVTVDGRILTGIVASDTASSVTLKQPEGKVVSLLRQDIEEMHSSGVSLMPEGLEKNIPPQQMADLISFIKNWRYLDGKTPLR